MYSVPHCDIGKRRSAKQLDEIKEHDEIMNGTEIAWP